MPGFRLHSIRSKQITITKSKAVFVLLITERGWNFTVRINFFSSKDDGTIPGEHLLLIIDVISPLVDSSTSFIFKPSCPVFSLSIPDDDEVPIFIDFEIADQVLDLECRQLPHPCWW